MSQMLIGQTNDRLRITSTDILYPVVVGIGVRKGNKDLLDALSGALERLKRLVPSNITAQPELVAAISKKAAAPIETYKIGDSYTGSEAPVAWVSARTARSAPARWPTA